MVTRDKLIFSSAITRILRYFSVSFPLSDHFHVMCAIDAATVKRSEAQFCSRRSGLAAPPTPLALSTSTPSTSTGGVTLNVIMAQLQSMDAHLGTLSAELYQVNTRVGRIAWWQARLGGFVESPSPSLEASEDEDDDGDADEDEDASSSGDDEMTASQWLALCHLWQKGGVVLCMRVVMYLGGELV